MTTQTITVPIPSERNTERTVDLGNGRWLTGALSPFDFPQYVRLSIDDSTVVVELLYSVGNDEKTELYQGSNGISVKTGADSGRVLAIFATRKSVHEAQGRIESTDLVQSLAILIQAAKRMIANETAPRRLAHYEMISDLFPFIDEKLKDLRP